MGQVVESPDGRGNSQVGSSIEPASGAITRLEMPAAQAEPVSVGSSVSEPGRGPGPFQASELIRHELDLLRRAVVLTRGDVNRARDLVQDTYERALRNVGRLVPGSNLRAWLYTIMGNRFLDTVRAERLRWTVADTSAREVPAAEPEPVDWWTKITAEDLRAALKQLDSRLRTVFELREFDHLSYEAIAARLDVPRATVGTRLCRARTQLREILSSGLDPERSR